MKFPLEFSHQFTSFLSTSPIFQYNQENKQLKRVAEPLNPQSNNMSPTRVAIIGLGIGEGDFTAGLWAAHVHLPYFINSPDFEVVAICNSSVASAQKSIEYHKLPSSTKAYGSPSDLASDPDVDMVLVSVKVAKHYELTAPILEAGKDVFVEWPLGANLAEAKALTAKAKEKNVKTIVGTQARASPLIMKLREIIKNGDIGTVLSTVAQGNFSALPIDVFITGAEYFLDGKSGGNSLTIFFGHFLDSFLHVLGPFSPKEEDFSAILETKFPDVKMMDATWSHVGDYKRTSPDHIAVQGKLSSGAIATINYSTFPHSALDEGVRWTISGTKGQIVVTTGVDQWQNMPNEKIVVKVKKAEKDVEIVELEKQVFQGSVSKGYNTAREWEAFRKGDKEEFADFEQATKSHEVLDRIMIAAGQGQ